ATVRSTAQRPTQRRTPVRVLGIAATAELRVIPSTLPVQRETARSRTFPSSGTLVRPRPSSSRPQSARASAAESRSTTGWVTVVVTSSTAWLTAPPPPPLPPPPVPPP